MKNIKIYSVFLIAIIFVAGIGCKKFLNVTPQNALSGNNFWKDKNDVQNFMNGIYLQYRNATMQNRALFTASGDFRASSIWDIRSGRSGSKGNIYVNDVITNDMVSAVTQNDANVRQVMDWTNFYQAIQSCNILLKEIDRVPTGKLTANEEAGYKAEAVFMRSLCYFTIVRLFGDVPYNNTAYDTSAHARLNQVTVFNNCITDLKASLNDLPWTYAQVSDVASRANKGAAIDLMMNMNMWNANFDPNNKQQYWKATDSLGGILMNDNGGAYSLVPIKSYKTIFAGHSKESLFEIEQNANGKDTFNVYGQFANYVLGYKLNPEYQFITSAPTSGLPLSELYIDTKAMDELYPNGTPDQRFSLWVQNPDKTDGNFAFIKFSNMVYNNGNYIGVSTDAHVIFRLAGAILLRAEAVNDLGQTDDALTYLNMIKSRANAAIFNSANQSDIDTEIFWERCRELMGEGWYYYDLVRTKKLLDPTFCKAIPSSDYVNGGWTWPISISALNQNPNMILNNFWNVSY